MKKTLIALVVAASAAVSGSAMAWTAHGMGGSVNLGGTLTPVEKSTPWEVKVGDSIANLDQQIQKGQRQASISVDKPILILGIRTLSHNAFRGQDGISPQIDFHENAQVEDVIDGCGMIRVNVHDKVKHEKIGEMLVPMLVGGEFSAVGGGTHEGRAQLIAPQPGSAFYGGLPAAAASLMDPATVMTRISSLDNDIVANFDTQGQSNSTGRAEGLDFKGEGVRYSAYYGAGIEKGQRIQLSLEQPVESEDLTWEATLPITVSYM
ncbi:hypothetical protein H8U88_RS19990 [Escherichia coli]|nr:hypothetical protein [Escherichia coli]